jgi:hypothetical protein
VLLFWVGSGTDWPGHRSPFNPKSENRSTWPRLTLDRHLVGPFARQVCPRLYVLP